ncbi:MAG: hypothetical protein M1815_004725 [Lichina confinis]|nr:MAG: hypothetical protein M1815_004725 [Lichina confinis]
MATSWSRQNGDPYTNAGYVHLFCLEKLMDLPQLIRNCNFIADNRALPSEPAGVNRMGLGGATVFRTAQRFISGCRDNTMPTFMSRFLRGLKQKGHDLTVDGTMTQLLNIAKLIEEPETRARQRQQRGTSTSLFDHHLGNLIKMNKKKGKKRTLPLDDSSNDSSEKTVVAPPPESEQQPAEEPRTKKRKVAKNSEHDKEVASVAPTESVQQPAEESRTKKRKLVESSEQDNEAASVASAEPEQKTAEEPSTKKRKVAENTEQVNEAARTIAEVAFRRLFKGNVPQRRRRSSSIARRRPRSPSDSPISLPPPPASASSSPLPEPDVPIPSVEPPEAVFGTLMRNERESAPSPSPHATGFARTTSTPSTRRSSAADSLFSSGGRLGGKSQRSVKTEGSDEDDIEVGESSAEWEMRHRVLGGRSQRTDDNDLEMEGNRRGRKRLRRE